MLIKKGHVFLEDSIAQLTLIEHFSAILGVVKQLDFLAGQAGLEGYNKFHRAKPGRPSQLPSVQDGEDGMLTVGYSHRASYAKALEHVTVELDQLPFSILRDAEGRFWAVDNHRIQKDVPQSRHARFKGMREITVIRSMASPHDIERVIWSSNLASLKRAKSNVKEACEHLDTEAALCENVLARSISRFFSHREASLNSPEKVSKKEYLIEPLQYSGRICPQQK